MGTLKATMMATFGEMTHVLGTGGSIAKGTSILIILFLGFAALIIVFQFIPGLVLLCSMLKGLFKASPKKAAVTYEKK